MISDVDLKFAAEDYSADMGLTRTPSLTEMIYARQKLVTTAKAFGIQAIDLVKIYLNLLVLKYLQVCTDYKSMQTLEDECISGLNMGFVGKQGKKYRIKLCTY